MKQFILAILLIVLGTPVIADTVAQARSTEGHRLRLTNEPCTKASGRSTERAWGRTYSWQDSGTTVAGCGRLDGDTVVIEWATPQGLDIRRYSAHDFLWIPARK